MVQPRRLSRLSGRRERPGLSCRRSPCGSRPGRPSPGRRTCAAWRCATCASATAATRLLGSAAAAATALAAAAGLVLVHLVERFEPPLDIVRDGVADLLGVLRLDQVFPALQGALLITREGLVAALLGQDRADRIVHQRLADLGANRPAQV